MSFQFVAECLDCGQQTAYSPSNYSCPNCDSQWQEAHYDYEEAARDVQASLAGRPFNLWRYRELLPVREPNPIISLGEGGTPLIHALNLGMMLGCPHIYIKDERQGPTASFKDRQAAVSISALKEAGITEAVLASTGNVAISYSAYAARAGIKLWAFLTSLVPPEKMREVSIYGTQVVKVTGTYDQAKQVAAEFARQRKLYLERGPRSIPSVEAMKTISYEISEQLSWSLGPRSKNVPPVNVVIPRWRAPDWYFQSVSGGIGPLGVHKGFIELRKMGICDHIPAMANIQVEGCAPMVHAWRRGLEIAEPVRSPHTHIATLATGDPGRTYTLLYQRMQETGGGCFESVSDDEAYRAMHVLGKMEGISVEPAAAVAFAGLIKLARSGVIRPDEVIVVNCSGHTMPVEQSAILGLPLSLELAAQPVPDTPEEGLLAALNRMTSDRFPRIEIVDDHPDARRLIRRILQSQGNYTFFEVDNGPEAVQVAQRELPDLIILDLMMPEYDGFSVLDALKGKPETSPIPVIVVTAKDLTPQEKKRLEGRIFALKQKGEFMSDELMDEIRMLLS